MNKIMLIGNLTFDPEVRVTPSGVTVCTFNIAVNRRFANQNGERQTDFFRIVAWRQLGENCGKYLTKGKKVFVSGELQVRNYEAKDGTQKTTVEVSAEDIEFLSPRSQDGQNGFTPATASPYQQPNPSVTVIPPKTAVMQTPDGFTDMDEDELPF